MEAPEPHPPWLAEVMAAIVTCQSTFTAKIEAVQMDVWPPAAVYGQVAVSSDGDGTEVQHYGG